ncbi:Alkaline phosphatase [Microcystis panniformis FACHB-1757]|uniref:Alkaline phosphatase n=1 Tax=Microcystis panniformis FACHB-1757 TaxID=1638788 RepID=A0A0K1RZE1_9CHRO|nr:Alkaline phosphatase [Microcystis panniformis FACHB-1757]
MSFDGASPITFDLTGSDDLTVSREISPLAVLNSNPFPSTVSSEAPTVPVSPAATGQVDFPASPSIDSSGYSTSPAPGPASVPTAAPVTSELRPAATSTLAPHAPNQLILKFKQGITSAEVAQFRSLFGAVSTQTIKLTGSEIWNLSGSLSVEKILAQYGSNPIFEYIEPDYILTKGTITPKATFPNDPSFNQLWGLHNTGQSGGTPDADIDAPEAWDIQTGNPNLVIGVIDTGVDYNHPDLAGNIWTNPGEIANDGIDNDGNGYVDDIRGWDFAYNDNNPSDVQGHGTHVAGTIAGKGNNGVGVTGVAWNAKIMPLKFLNDQGSGSTSNAILAINYATDKGVKLTNNSWGGGGYSQALYDAINAAGQAGALFIAAAGNSSANADINPMYPAAYNLDNIVSVASTTRTDDLSWFSNYGLNSVDLGAPGSDIYSLAPGGGYATLSGTSMASPHVAGAAALLWSQNPTWTAQQVKNALMNTGDPLASLAGKTVSGKRLNVFNALAGANLPSVTVSVSPASVQEDGTTNLVYTFTRTNLNLSSPLTVNFGASGIANAAPVGSDPADYNVLTGSAVTFNPTTKLGTVNFAAGATTATVVVDPIADTIAEIANETVALTVNSGTGYIGGSPGTATGTIISEETLPIFSNPNPITIPSSGTSTPYPSTINVSGLSGNINSLKVTLTNLSHTWPDDIDVLLVGPTGTKALLMSDVGGSSGVNNVTLTFDPTATSSLPDSGLITSGSYKATDFETGDFFNAPAPGGPYGTDFSVFNGINPNGTWSLYVVDDAGGDAGTIAGGWSLLIGTGTATPVVTVAATDAVAGEPANNGQYTLTRTGSTTSALTVNIAMSGTATNGKDYTTIPTTVTFLAGSSTAVVNLNVIDDTLVEGTETATLTVLAGSGYTPGSLDNKSGSATASQGNVTPSSSATVSIADNDTGGTITLNAADTGWYDSTGFHGPTNTNYFVGDNNIADGKLYRNWFTFNLPTLTAPIISAQLKVNTYDYDSLQPSETYELRDVTTAVPTLTAGGSGKTAIYADLGDGAIYGSRTYTNADDNKFSTIDLNGAAISALTAKSGQAFALGGLLTTLDTIDNSEYVFGFSEGFVGDVQLILNTGTATPVVTVAATDAVAGEPANNGQYTLTRTGSTTSALTVNIAMSGTATNGKDYTTIPTTVTFLAGSSTAVVNLNVIDDTLVEGTETATLTVLAGSGYTPGSLDNKSGSATASQGNVTPSSSATVSIADNDTGGTITLNAADTGWYDSTGFHGPTNTNYFVGDNNIADGKLYRNWFTFNLPTLTAPIISAQLKVNTYDYDSLQPSETYELRDVTTAVPTLTAGGSGKTAIYADLGDGAIYGSRTYTNADDNKFSTIDLNGAAISALTAKSGQAFALGGLLTTLDTIDNSEYVFGFSEGFVGDVQLILNTGTATPVVTVAATDAVAGEPANNGQYTLTRTGSTTSALTVNIAMSGTATNGKDYTTIPTTVTFLAGSSTAVVNLNVIDDTLVEGTETATLTVLAGSGYTPGSLDNKSGSATASQGNVTPSSSATVSIADNDTGGTITLNAADTGWYDSTGFHGPTNTNYAAGDNNIADGKLYRNWFTFNLPTLTAPIISAQLKVNTYDYDSLQPSETYELRDVTTAVPTLTAGGSGKTAIYADLGDGAIYGSRTYTNADDNKFSTIDLNGAAISALTAKSGQAFALGGLLTTLDTIDNSEYVFGFSGGFVGDVQLILNTGTATPVVTLASNYSGVSEDGVANLIYTFTRSGPTTSALAVNFSVAGTANAADYTGATPGTATITFAAGSSTASLTINPTADTVKEPNETVSLTITSGSGYTIGTTSPVVTTIINDDGVINQQGTTGDDVVEAGTTRTLSGRAGNDILLGSSASEVLVGGVGNDKITSGVGFDVIAYSLASEGQDTITDFNVFQDTLQVSAAGFGGGLIAGESIAAAQFVLGTVATTASHRFIFNQPTGQLFFDVDGNGSSVQTLLATLTPGLSLTEDNIFAA